MSPTARAVRFDAYGGPDVLRVEEIPMPEAGPGRVLVEVRAAGINPGEGAIRRGDFSPTGEFPSGEGSDLAGVVVGVGGGVSDIAVGDEVLGYSWERSSHASHVAVPAEQLIRKPPALSWEVAGGLYVVGATAWAAVNAVPMADGDVVAVSAAGGGVGRLVVQLARMRGARVLGIASESNAEWLRAHGAEAIAYGSGLRERLEEAAPDGIDAFLDQYGNEYVELAAALGVVPERINTIIGFAAAGKIGARTQGSTDGSSREVLRELAEMLAAGRLELDIAATYPLDQVADAFREVERGHTHGKIVLIP